MPNKDLEIKTLTQKLDELRKSHKRLEENGHIMKANHNMELDNVKKESLYLKEELRRRDVQIKELKECNSRVRRERDEARSGQNRTGMNEALKKEVQRVLEENQNLEELAAKLREENYEQEVEKIRLGVTIERQASSLKQVRDRVEYLEEKLESRKKRLMTISEELEDESEKVKRLEVKLDKKRDQLKATHKLLDMNSQLNEKQLDLLESTQRLVLEQETMTMTMDILQMDTSTTPVVKIKSEPIDDQVPNHCLQIKSEPMDSPHHRTGNLNREKSAQINPRPGPSPSLRPPSTSPSASAPRRPVHTFIDEPQNSTPRRAGTGYSTEMESHPW
jgi:chromosome segregation ATPase